MSTVAILLIFGLFTVCNCASQGTLYVILNNDDFGTFALNILDIATGNLTIAGNDIDGVTVPGGNVLVESKKLMHLLTGSTGNGVTMLQMDLVTGGVTNSIQLPFYLSNCETVVWDPSDNSLIVTGFSDSATLNYTVWRVSQDYKTVSFITSYRSTGAERWGTTALDSNNILWTPTVRVFELLGFDMTSGALQYNLTDEIEDDCNVYVLGTNQESDVIYGLGISINTVSVHLVTIQNGECNVVAQTKIQTYALVPIIAIDGENNIMYFLFVEYLFGIDLDNGNIVSQTVVDVNGVWNMGFLPASKHTIKS